MKIQVLRMILPRTNLSIRSQTVVLAEEFQHGFRKYFFRIIASTAHGKMKSLGKDYLIQSRSEFIALPKHEAAFDNTVIGTSQKTRQQKLIYCLISLSISWRVESSNHNSSSVTQNKYCYTQTPNSKNYPN